MLTKVNKLPISLWVVLVMLILQCCKNQNFPVTKNEEGFLFRWFECKKLDDFNLSRHQVRKLNSELRRKFGRDLHHYCYTYECNANGLGLVEAFDFHSHRHHFYFIFSGTEIAVLQAERKPISLLASFESRIRLFEKDFNRDTIDEMRKLVEDHVKATGNKAN